MKMVRDFEKRAESVGQPVTDKLSGELRRRVWPTTKLQYPYPACVTEEGEVVAAEKLKFTLRNSKN